VQQSLQRLAQAEPDDEDGAGLWNGGLLEQPDTELSKTFR
jgi:hypothetical protein